MRVLKMIEKGETNNERPVETAVIKDGGEYSMNKPDSAASKMSSMKRK